MGFWHNEVSGRILQMARRVLDLTIYRFRGKSQLATTSDVYSHERRNRVHYDGEVFMIVSDGFLRQLSIQQHVSVGF